MTAVLIEKLARRDSLSVEERGALEALPVRILERRAGEHLVEEDARPAESTLLLDGLTARYITLLEGGRQITQINVAGDFVDLHSLLMKQMDHGVVAFTVCRTALYPHDALREITEQFPHLARLLWLDTVIDAAIHRQWIAGLGRRTAVSRLAHLICELYLRLAWVDKASDGVLRLPLSQGALADVLGLSAVHVNRCAAALRADRLVEWRDQGVRILAWDRLVDLAEFDPNYLRLHAEPV